jgi:YgiT-type zinc finger domain-containing protein
MNTTQCPVCGQAAQLKFIPKAFGKGEDLLVIEDIPLVVCRHCHEQYVSAKVLHEIERLRQQKAHQSRIVQVERFAQAA